MVKLSDRCSYRKVWVADRWVGAAVQNSHRRVKNGNSEVNMKGWTLGVRHRSFLEGWRRREGIHIYGVPTVCSELFLVHLISCNPHNMTERQIAKKYSVRIWTHIYLTSKSSFHQTKIENSHGSEQGYMEAETKETNLRLQCESYIIMCWIGKASSGQGSLPAAWGILLRGVSVIFERQNILLWWKRILSFSGNAQSLVQL